MNFHILTLFPEMVTGGLGTSITGRAMEKGLISVEAVNIRDYSKDKHRHVDDYPYGGGAGMVMQPGPICDAYEDLAARTGKRPRVIYMTPQGRVFSQRIAEELAKEEDLVFLCGHYEGIDERALELIVTDYLSIGDYVLTGGELPAMVMIDCISRLVPGVLNNETSAEFESFHDNLLEYPQYTRPEVFMDKKVPDVLLSGHHKNIDTWRREKSIERTLERRPDLLKDAVLSKKERAYLAQLLADRGEMAGAIKMIPSRRKPGDAGSPVSQFGVLKAGQVRRFHASFPEYRETPLVELKNLAKELGAASVYVKDESFRFGLNAFKVLGGSYCLGNYIAERLGMDPDGLTYEALTDRRVKEALGELTFVTATDGNHGRGIAWTAGRLGLKSVVYMPKGSSPERLNHIRALGADASITEFNYDDSVRLANANAEKYGWVMVQDTAWEGYEKIPSWIMQGYTTMAAEADEQLKGVRPTHIFLQAGVGAMAGAVTGYFADRYRDGERPVITIVEPSKADCIYRTAEADDGKLHPVRGAMDTIMAGLACGEPCTIGWRVLRDYADYFVSMPDWVAAKGMRVLGSPVGDDPRVISGESGASTLGFVAEVMRNPSLSRMKEELGLNRKSRILCFSTEGDTDRENYRRIVWDGLYGSSLQ